MWLAAGAPWAPATRALPATRLCTTRSACIHRVVAVDEIWEQTIARRLLVTVGTRYRHSACVAERAADAARVLLPLDAANTVTRAAWLHDIGYSPELAQTGFHALDGARWLRDRNVDPSVCDLVAFHTAAHAEAMVRGLADQLAREFDRPDAASLRVLTWADMTSSHTGHPCRVDDRIAEILGRYPAASPAFRAVSAARTELVEIGLAVSKAIGSSG